MLVAASGCLQRETCDVAEGKTRAAMVFLSLSALSDAINTDTQTWEDRVSEIRMLAFLPSGAIAYNEMLSFSNGFGAPSDAVAMQPGTYSFYFIANETAYTGDFTTALQTITNVAQFATDARFATLTYDPAFAPDGTTSGGRFLMSAVYNDITVAQGGTQAAPLPLPLPTPTVQLVRSLAKVDVIFRKKVTGSSVPDGTITSVQLQDVAGTFSVPPIDNYYTGATAVSNTFAPPAGLDYAADSIGAVTFYVPEFLRPAGAPDYTAIVINGNSYPLTSDTGFIGITAQRRTLPALSTNSVVRNYNYRVNVMISSGGEVVALTTSVVPWSTASYTYMFQGDQTIVIPPVIPTPPGIIFPTSCGTIEMRSTNEALHNGLMGALGYTVYYYDAATGGPLVTQAAPPYYCEQKYGAGWRLIKACEMMSFLALFDQTYRIWQSNTWQGINSHLPFYPANMRLQAQNLLQALTGVNLSAYTPSDASMGADPFGSNKLGIIDDFFTPGDIIVRLQDYPGGWPYPSPPTSGIEPWYPMETVTQVKGYWYQGYLEYADPANYAAILYQQFQRFSFSSTISRCVRSVD